MTEQQLARESTRARIEQVRGELETTLAGLDDTTLAQLKATPQWSAADVLRHMLCWTDVTLRCLDDWNGSRAGLLPPIDDGDALNAHMLSLMSDVAPSAAYRRLGALYDRMIAILDTESDAELAAAGEAPWGGQISRINLIDSMIGHDVEHAAMMAAARQR